MTSEQLCLSRCLVYNQKRVQSGCLSHSLRQSRIFNKFRGYYNSIFTPQMIIFWSTKFFPKQFLIRSSTNRLLGCRRSSIQTLGYISRKISIKLAWKQRQGEGTSSNRNSLKASVISILFGQLSCIELQSLMSLSLVMSELKFLMCSAKNRRASFSCKTSPMCFQSISQNFQGQFLYISVKIWVYFLCSCQMTGFRTLDLLKRNYYSGWEESRLFKGVSSQMPPSFPQSRLENNYVLPWFVGINSKIAGQHPALPLSPKLELGLLLFWLPPTNELKILFLLEERFETNEALGSYIPFFKLYYSFNYLQYCGLPINLWLLKTYCSTIGLGTSLLILLLPSSFKFVSRISISTKLYPSQSVC